MLHHIIKNQECQEPRVPCAKQEHSPSSIATDSDGSGRRPPANAGESAETGRGREKERDKGDKRAGKSGNVMTQTDHNRSDMQSCGSQKHNQDKRSHERSKTNKQIS